MSDLISRQAAIDAVKAYWKKVVDDIPKGVGFEELTQLCDMALEHNANILKAIDQLPSTQPEQRWIPCSERLPEEHEWVGTKRFGTTISDEVYVTFENPEGERFTKHLSFQNGKLSSFDQRKIDAFYNGSVPIAWMPLPEPYREERTEE